MNTMVIIPTHHHFHALLNVHDVNGGIRQYCFGCAIALCLLWMISLSSMNSFWSTKLLWFLSRWFVVIAVVTFLSWTFSRCSSNSPPPTPDKICCLDLAKVGVSHNALQMCLLAWYQTWGQILYTPPPHP